MKLIIEVEKTNYLLVSRILKNAVSNKIIKEYNEIKNINIIFTVFGKKKYLYSIENMIYNINEN